MTAAALGSAALPQVAAGQASATAKPLPYNSATSDAMPTRNLGKTGYKSQQSIQEEAHHRPEQEDDRRWRVPRRRR